MQIVTLKERRARAEATRTGISTPDRIDVEAALASAVHHFRMAAELYSESGFANAGLDGYRVRMAFMHAIQAGHTSFEMAMSGILALLGEEAPSGETWRADLIRRISRDLPDRPAIIDANMARAASETLGCRNAAISGEDVFSSDRARRAAAAACTLSRGLQGATSEIRASLETGWR